MPKQIQTLTISETVDRLRCDGLPLAEYALRRFVKTGAIPSVKCGRKSLLYYPNVVRFLTQEDTSQPTT